MAASYRLAPRSQQRMDVPSGDDRWAVTEMRQLIGQGRTKQAERSLNPFRKNLNLRRTYTSSGEQVTATHYSGSFYSQIMVRDPSSVPLLWLALQAFREVAGRTHAVGREAYVARPAGILVVSSSTGIASSRFHETRDRHPLSLEGISVHPAEQAEGSDIKIHRPGATMPEALEGLAIAAEHLQPGSLGPDPKDELARQIGWEEYGALEQVWGGSLRQDSAYLAAHYCLQAYGVSGVLESV